MVQPVPDERKAELQKILDENYPQRTIRSDTSCDTLQAEMNTMFASSFSDPAAGAMYMSCFFQALINGCDFLYGNEYHVDPTDGACFQLECLHKKDQYRGRKIIVKEGEHGAMLYSNSQDRYYNKIPPPYADGVEVYSLFHMVPTGEPHLEGRQPYYLMIDDGRWAGRTISSIVDGGHNLVVARELREGYGPVTLDPDHHEKGHPGSGSFINYYLSHTEGTDLGVLHIPSMEDDTPTRYADHTEWQESIWYFRPPDFMQ